jgi:K+-transporting ATPase KdpF subunit
LRYSRWPSRAASGCEDVMLVDFVIGGAVALLLLGYLVYALIRPEKF